MLSAGSRGQVEENKSLEAAEIRPTLINAALISAFKSALRCKNVGSTGRVISNVRPQKAMFALKHSDSWLAG